KRRRHQLNFRRRHAVKIRAGGDIDDSNLNLRRRVGQRYIGPSFMLFRRIPADDKPDTNHMMPSIGCTVHRYATTICAACANFRIRTTEELRTQRRRVLSKKDSAYSASLW